MHVVSSVIFLQTDFVETQADKWSHWTLQDCSIAAEVSLASVKPINEIQNEWVQEWEQEH